MIDAVILYEEFNSFCNKLPFTILLVEPESLLIVYANSYAEENLNLRASAGNAISINEKLNFYSSLDYNRKLSDLIQENSEFRDIRLQSAEDPNEITHGALFNFSIGGKSLRLLILYGVTTDKLQFEQLKYDQNNLLDLIEIYPNGIFFIIDSQFQIQFAGGLEAKNLLGTVQHNLKNIKELIPESYKEKFDIFTDRLCAGEYPVMNIKLGHNIYQIAGSCTFNNENQPERGLLIFQNITEQMNTRKQIQLQSDILDKVIDAVIVKDLNGNITYWNEGAVNTFGYSVEEMIGASIGTILSRNNDLIKFHQVRDQVLDSEMVSVETEAYCKNGNSIFIETHQSLMRDASGKPEKIICVSRDISKRVANDRIVKESEANLKAIFQTTSQSFVLFDTSFRIITFNKNAKNSFKRFLDYDLLEGEFFPVYQNESTRLLFIKRMQRVLQKEIIELESVYEINDGTFEYVNVTYSPVLDDNKVIAIVACGEHMTDEVMAKKALEKSEQKYRDLVETSIDLIWTIDEKGTVLFVNKSALESFGWSPDEIIGHNFLRFVSDECKQRVKDDVLNAFENYEHYFNYESRIVMKDGTQVDLLTNAVIHKDAEHPEKRFLTATSRNITDRVKAEVELNEKNQQLRRLSTFLQSVREKERSHISREIHDELGQQLTGLKLDLFSLNKKFGMQIPELHQQLNEVIRSVDETVKSVRKIATDLRPGILDDLGLIPAIEWLCSEFQKRNQIECNFKTTIANPSITKDVATGVFRILQEALTNIARHSGAKSLQIELTNPGSNYMMIISDNGIGFSTDSIIDKQTLGLVGMQERAGMLNGSLTFYSEAGKGTDIILEFPIFTSELSYNENINS